MKTISCNHIGNHYIRKGAHCYVAQIVGDPAVIKIVVRSRGGRWIHKWIRKIECYNFRITTGEHPPEGALQFPEKVAQSKLNFLRRFKNA